MKHPLTEQMLHRLALISDIGGPAASGTTFYYNLGSRGAGLLPTDSFGPGPAAVSQLVQSWGPSDVLAVGDLAYTTGGSTLQDISIGLYFNNFIHPYPSPLYLKRPYTKIAGAKVQNKAKQWPFNIYNYPFGFPNPLVPRLMGGSPDRRNHFWGSLGNHDYGSQIGYGQTGLTSYDFQGEPTGTPIGPSSAISVRSSIDYFLPFLNDPSLLGPDQARLRIGAADSTGNRGAYYAISFGGSSRKPLIDFFMLDTERLNINAGFEDWNPSGSKSLNQNTGQYENTVEADPSYSFTYNPSDPNSLALPNTTTDPDNGYDQYTWLRQQLVKSTARWKVITGHHPVYTSGRWSDVQPADHMSNPYLQRLLKALPAGSFDAYYNGHDHYYERVLESREGGIGLGIPFITNGNAGRILSEKIQVPYGQSIYEPTLFDPQSGSNPNSAALPYLLNSNPIAVGSSGLTGNGNETETYGINNGLYGYGFGAVKVDISPSFLLFEYEEASLTDPAIANHLSDGVQPEPGFKNTSPQDWIPDPTGEFKGQSDLAQFKLEISDGRVIRVDVVNGGNGYMSSKGGDYIVRGFNVYGNNVNPLKPWEATAQVDLTFKDGSLLNIELVDGGRGYELVPQAAANNNITQTTADLPEESAIIIGIDYNIEEVLYLVRDEQRYNDWYLITKSEPVIKLEGQAGQPGTIELKIRAASRDARALLNDELDLTTGYSGQGQQSFSRFAQDGDFVIYSRGETIAKGNLDRGVWRGSVANLPSQSDDLIVQFEGDPISSYNINFKPSNRAARIVKVSDKNADLSRSYEPMVGNKEHFHGLFPSMSVPQLTGLEPSCSFLNHYLNDPSPMSTNSSML